jgi:hypothetical protein
MAFQLVYLSQQDPQWKNDLLGFGDPGDTLGMYGCALTSVAMLLGGHGYSETPKTLNEKMKAANGFVSSGIRWDVVSKVHPQITLREQVSCENTDAPLAKINAALDAGQPVVVRVDSSPAPGLQWHYVMVYARQGNDYLMLDPYPYSPGTAKPDLLMARYSRGIPLERSIQQVLFYNCSTASGGTTSTPASSTPTKTTPPSQPTTGTSLGSGPRARVMAEVTWGLNVRSSTDTSSMANLVVNVPAGTELALLEANAESKIGGSGQWVRVRTAQGQEGYAAAWYLEKVVSTTPAPVTVPVSSPVNEAPVTPSTTPAPPVTEPTAPPVETPATPPVETPVTPPPPPKVQVVVKAAGTKIYSSATSVAVVATEKANARLTVVEPVDGAKAKIGVKSKRINVKASTGSRGFVDADKVRLA